MLRHQRHDAGETGCGAVAVLVVDGVDHAASGEFLQTGLEDLRFGGIQHDRQGHGRGQSPGQLLHVTDAVAADVVDAQVQYVCAVARLPLGDLHAVVDIAGQHRLPKGLGAVRVGAFPDVEVAEVLVERHLHVQRRAGSLRRDLAGTHLTAPEPFREQPDVGRGGSTAPTDHAQPVVVQEGRQGVRQRIGAERVDRAFRGQFGQARVGHGADAAGRVSGQVPEVFAHLGRPGGAVQSDHVDAEGLQGGAGRPDLGAEQHGAGGLDGDVDQDRQIHPEPGPGAFRGDHRSLGLQEVLAGLDLHGVDAARDHGLHLGLVGVTDVGEGDVPQAGEFRPGTH